MRLIFLITILFFLVGCEDVTFKLENLEEGRVMCEKNGGTKRIKLNQTFQSSQVKNISFHCSNGVIYHYQIVPKSLQRLSQ